MKYVIGSIIAGIALVALAIAYSPAPKHATELVGQTFVSTYQQTADATLIDVRTPAEYATGHLDGAININLQDPSFDSQISALPKDKPYFLYCHTGNRSGQAVSYMLSQGFANISELTGGLSGNPTLPLVLKNTTTTIASSTAYTVDPSDMVDETTLVGSLATSTLTSDERAGLIKMREEEKLAHDVYTVLGQTWNLPIFTNIAASEETHADAMKVLLDRYEITDPVGTNGLGVFTSPDMQTLYNTLVAQGKSSINDALTVGATIEDLDIRDLDMLLASTTQKDIILTYENLQKGSRNHMRAFVKNITARGGTYTPEYISADEYQQIITSPQERGAITTIPN